MLLSDGRFAPYRDCIDREFHALRGKLSAVGLGSTPLALSRGLMISLLPSLLFGCEIWGIDEIYDIFIKQKSVYNCKFMDPLLQNLKRYIGLPPASSNAAVCHLFNIPTFLSLVVKRLAKACAAISPQQWGSIEYVAEVAPKLTCHKLVVVRDILLALPVQGNTVADLVRTCE